MKFTVPLLLMILLSVSYAEVKIPKGFEKVDKTIKLGPMHGDIRFDKEVLEVKPGEKIRIDFVNKDEMPHNILVCVPGTDTKALGEKALMMGAEGLKAGYVPKSDKIISSMPLVEPGKTGTMFFQVPNKKCVLPYVCTIPGHYLKMVGKIYVGIKPPKPGKPKVNYEITVLDVPHIYRSGISIPDVGKKAFSIGVGLPGGMNYTFDAESCVVTAAWKGKFLDCVNDWRGRGGKGAKIIGDIFYKNKDQRTLKLSSDGTPKYAGYRVHKGIPTFIYYVGKHKVQLTVTAKEGKLIKKFTVIGVPSATYSAVAGAKVTAAGKALTDGQFKKDARPGDGMLVLEVEVAP